MAARWSLTASAADVVPAQDAEVKEHIAVRGRIG
jgi:hypothetical protein